jgi:adenylate cyclase
MGYLMTEKAKRKLTAILSADVKGYSRLMGEDEKGTVRTLNAYREVMANLIQHHYGRVVDTPGDNLLAEFASVVDAVECSVEIQKELKTRNAELPENRKMEFRIGINLGDVIEEEGRIYGDGVNIAARLESLSEAGGICISGKTYDEIKNKLPLGYKYLGEQTVKNITEPMRTYQVLMEPEAVGKVIGEEKVRPRQSQRVVLGLVIGMIVVIAAVVIWKYYIPPTLRPKVAQKEKIVASQPEKAPTVAPPSIEGAPKEKVGPPSPEKVAKPAPPPASKMEAASKEKMAFPLPDKPSIAVMAFLNMTGDQSQDFFCDGLSESLITALSKVPQLFLISRDSTFSYKGKTVKTKQVSEDLGVQYVLEGSVQRARDQVRVTAQLIDALNGHHLWADRYDREFKDLFAILDDITKRIITALNVKLTHGESARIYSRGTENLDAYLKAQEAVWYAVHSTRTGLDRARQLAEEAVALDPNFPYAYQALGAVHMHDALAGFSKNPRESLEVSNKMLQKAIELDGSSNTATARAILAWNMAMLGKHDEALAAVGRAYELAPNAVLYLYGTILAFSGRAEEALPLLKEALRLNPRPPNSYLRSLIVAYRLAGRFEEAIAWAKTAVQREPDDIIAQASLTFQYSLAGREEEARAAAKEVMRINPGFSVKRFTRTMPYRDPAEKERLAQALKKAGLK